MGKKKMLFCTFGQQSEHNNKSKQNHPKKKLSQTQKTNCFVAVLKKKIESHLHLCFCF